MGVEVNVFIDDLLRFGESHELHAVNTLRLEYGEEIFRQTYTVSKTIENKELFALFFVLAA